MEEKESEIQRVDSKVNVFAIQFSTISSFRVYIRCYFFFFVFFFRFYNGIACRAWANMRLTTKCIAFAQQSTGDIVFKKFILFFSHSYPIPSFSPDALRLVCLRECHSGNLIKSISAGLVVNLPGCNHISCQPLFCVS